MVETYTKGSQTDCHPTHTPGRQSFSPVGLRKASSPEMMENGHFGKVDKSQEINEKDPQYIDSQTRPDLNTQCHVQKSLTLHIINSTIHKEHQRTESQAGWHMY